MDKEQIKVYTYTRVSTAMQTEGYSLDAQKERLDLYAKLNGFQIVGEYVDAGKSGKSVLGRDEFNRMINDIRAGKDDVSYVLVFKLSRFGRNAADVLNSLQIMQDFGVNLICVDDGIDSSKDSGKLVITVLSAVAEIERENISAQTMEGRNQKAREGEWNGGPPPYGFKLINGRLEIDEEEAGTVRQIFDLYANTRMGANGIAKYLVDHGVQKVSHRKNEKTFFDASYIRKILRNPVYEGKISYGRRRREKIAGTRNQSRVVNQDDYILVDGKHDAIVTEELWLAVQTKLKTQARKYEQVNRGKNERVHLLTGLIKCPVCGEGMLANKSIKRKPDGTKYRDYFYYACKHHSKQRGQVCSFKKQIREDLLDTAVEEIIIKLVENPRFADLMREKVQMQVDTTEIDKEIVNCQDSLRKNYLVKDQLIEEIDALDPDDRHYSRRKTDLNERLYKMYDKIDSLEQELNTAKEKKNTIERDKITGDNIYRFLVEFNDLYGLMDERERRDFMTVLISDIQIYEERQPNGQWIKSITFRLPIIDEDMSLSLDSENSDETVVLLCRQNA